MFNGDLIFQARVRAGHSLTRLARKTGLTHNQVHDLERGRYRPSHQGITLNKIRRLATELNLQVHELFAPTHEQDPTQEAADTQAPGASPPSPSRDAQALAALLIAVPTFRPSAVTATMADWDHARVQEAIQAVNTALAPLGLIIEEREDGVRSLAYTAGQTQRPHHLTNAMQTVRGGTPATMRMAYECLGSAVPNSRATYTSLESRAWLEAAGVTRFDHDLDTIGLTDEVAHGLLRTSAGWPKHRQVGLQLGSTSASVPGAG